MSLHRTNGVQGTRARESTACMSSPTLTRLCRFPLSGTRLTYAQVGYFTRHRSSDWIWHLAKRRSRIAVEWSLPIFCQAQHLAQHEPHYAHQRLKRLSFLWWHCQHRGRRQRPLNGRCMIVSCGWSAHRRRATQLSDAMLFLQWRFRLQRGPFCFCHTTTTTKQPTL